ncbi:EscI/YscI/HrpB family type III secretion system inner rod protein [Comamonas antarctica]|uniref:Type III secretion system major needle protein, YscF/MxiH/PrgI family n=1 Tax=Comamonas antarctica TaxID=2743470 RepID=A0A6N1X949_9BURK|nr:EscI/YscI/HrpB family type III secretion system inner rod protein [Comamonas antarctica]QKV54385.1 hypothetical protein HUK68_16535 [Comamonas antarctica]
MEIITGPVSAPPQRLAASVTAPPDAAATERFSTLMAPSAAESPGAVAQSIPAVDVQALEPAAAKAPANLGDRILSGTQNMSDEFRSSWARVYEILRAQNPELSMQDMFKLQLHLTQMSVQYDMFGKAVSRATQNFDQLVRVQ